MLQSCICSFYLNFKLIYDKRLHKTYYQINVAERRKLKGQNGPLLLNRKRRDEGDDKWDTPMSQKVRENQTNHGVKACGVRVTVGRRPQKRSRKLIQEPAGFIFTIVPDLEAKDLIPGA